MIGLVDRPKARKPTRLDSGKLPKDFDAGRLTEAMFAARLHLKKPRQERYKAVQEFAGTHYSDGGAEHPVPVNMIALYIQIMSSALISQDPRFMLSTTDTRRRPAVAACEDWLNKEVKDQYLAETLQRVVVDALFSVGILKVALADPGHAAKSGWRLSGGQPFAERVDLDDFVYDVFAHSFSECDFIGHRYVVPKAVADAMYEKGRDLDEDFRPDYNPTGDTKIGVIGRGIRRGEPMEDHVTLWEVYLPRHQLVLTLCDDPVYGATEDAKGVLRVQKWIGPPCGPYHFLGFVWVPGSARPKGPIMDLIDLHRAINRNEFKIIEDTDRWKSVLPVRGGAVDDAGKLRQANNGEMFQSDTTDLAEVQYGGPGNGCVAMAERWKALFSWLAGNLDIVGGLSPQSRTASQDEMLNENSSRTVGDKQQMVVNFTAKIGEALLWYYWNHPQKKMFAPITVPGVPAASAMRVVHPKGGLNRFGKPGRLQRTGPTPDIKVDPYSLSHSTPQQRLAFLNGFIQQAAPMLPLWAQQGVVLDANAYVELVAKYGDEPALHELFTTRQPVPQQGGDGGGDAPGMPANTSREYVRRSLGNDSAGAKQQQISNAANSGTSYSQGGQ